MDLEKKLTEKGIPIFMANTKFKVVLPKNEKITPN